MQNTHGQAQHGPCVSSKISKIRACRHKQLFKLFLSHIVFCSTKPPRPTRFRHHATNGRRRRRATSRPPYRCANFTQSAKDRAARTRAALSMTCLCGRPHQRPYPRPCPRGRSMSNVRGLASLRLRPALKSTALPSLSRLPVESSTGPSPSAAPFSPFDRRRASLTRPSRRRRCQAPCTTSVHARSAALTSWRSFTSTCGCTRFGGRSGRTVHRSCSL